MRNTNKPITFYEQNQGIIFIGRLCTRLLSKKIGYYKIARDTLEVFSRKKLGSGID